MISLLYHIATINVLLYNVMLYDFFLLSSCSTLLQNVLTSHSATFSAYAQLMLLFCEVIAYFCNFMVIAIKHLL